MWNKATELVTRLSMSRTLTVDFVASCNGLVDDSKDAIVRSGNVHNLPTISTPAWL